MVACPMSVLHYALRDRRLDSRQRCFFFFNLLLACRIYLWRGDKSERPPLIMSTQHMISYYTEGSELIWKGYGRFVRLTGSSIVNTLACGLSRDWILAYPVQSSLLCIISTAFTFGGATHFQFPAL